LVQPNTMTPSFHPLSLVDETRALEMLFHAGFTHGCSPCSGRNGGISASFRCAIPPTNPRLFFLAVGRSASLSHFFMAAMAAVGEIDGRDPFAPWTAPFSIEFDGHRRCYHSLFGERTPWAVPEPRVPGLQSFDLGDVCLTWAVEAILTGSHKWSVPLTLGRIRC